MGFKISKFKSALIETDFEKDGESLHLWIDSDVVTPNFLREIRAMVKNEASGNNNDIDANTENALYMARVLSKIIARWDAEDEDGKPILPNDEFFLELPLGFVGDLFIFAMQALAPKKTTEPTFDDTISPAEN